MLDPSLRDAVRALGSDPAFHRKSPEQRLADCVDTLNLFGEDGSDPLLAELCVQEATAWSKRRGGSVLGRLKKTLTIYDRDLCQVMGNIARPTVNAYVQGRLQEYFDHVDKRNLAALIDDRIRSLQAIRAELS